MRKTSYSVLVAHILRNATVQYGDFIGSAAADRADAGSLGLNEVVGIDAEKWWILAIEIYAAEPADLTEDCVRVFAVDRAREGINTAAELQAYGTEHGTIPVTEFQVHDVSAAEIVRNSFKRLAVQLRSRSLEQLELNVVSEDSLNYSGE
jgi:hypothetical protein